MRTHDWGRRVLLIMDSALFVTTLFGFYRINHLESTLLTQVTTTVAEDTPWNQAQILGLHDALKLSYIASLGLSGLLVITSLFKLSARTEMLSSSTSPSNEQQLEEDEKPVQPALVLKASLKSTSAPALQSVVVPISFDPADSSTQTASSIFISSPAPATISVSTPATPAAAFSSLSSPALLSSSNPPPAAGEKSPRSSQLATQGWEPLPVPPIPANAPPLAEYPPPVPISLQVGVGVATYVIVLGALKKFY